LSISTILSKFSIEMQTPVQVREHYEIEKEIASRLRNSKPHERATLYTWAYDELFRRVPHHPMLEQAEGERLTPASLREMGILGKFINKNSTYLEVGPGDCSFAIEVAKRVKKVYAVDVSTEITRNLRPPGNFELLLSDGTSIPIPPESADVIFSNQLMEHLHPDDAAIQLKNIFNSLKRHGVYYCVTPNRLSGPHDVSRSFDDEATGLHLKEYTVTELVSMFRQAGFVRTKIYFGFGRYGMFLPVFPYKVAERFLGSLPHKARKLVTFNRVSRILLGIRMTGQK
jgi:SAM-dependent methyltransferase